MAVCQGYRAQGIKRYLVRIMPLDDKLAVIVCEKLIFPYLLYGVTQRSIVEAEKLFPAFGPAALPGPLKVSPAYI